MPSIKKMKKTTIGKKPAFNTNTTNITPGRADSRKGFVMSNPSSINMGVGRKPGSGGKAMGAAKGRGGRAF